MKVCDLQQQLGDREFHSMEESDNKIELFDFEMAKNAFPEAKLCNSEHVAYFPFKLCHSIPRVNSRGRTFMPQVLQKSFHSLMDQCLDFEHELVDNNTTSRDRIIGHVKAVKFDGPVIEVSSAATLPKEPMPVTGLGCLYKRATGVNDIISETQKNPQKWRVSMECYHNWEQAYLWYNRDTLININEAPADMLDCISIDFVKKYKGKELAVCIGGMDKEIAFLGAALTTNPADSDAHILGFVAGINRELSSRKNFFMPFRVFNGMAKEVASGSFTARDKIVEQTIKELANIVAVGQTDAGGMDKHVHDVLSDGTIMPMNGHVHVIKTMHIMGGTGPMFSGVTDNVYEYAVGAVSNTQNDRQGVVHNHTWNISLKKKAKGTNGTAASTPDMSSVGNYSQADLASAIVTIGENEMKLQELMAVLAKEMASAGAAEKPDEVKASLGRINELANKLDKMNAEEEFKSRLESEIEARLKAGTMITKEKADETIKAMQAVADEKLEVEKKRLEVIAARRNKCLTAGVNLDFEFDGVTNAEGKPVKVIDRLESFGCDDSGNREFDYNFALWKKIAEQGVEEERRAAVLTLPNPSQNGTLQQVKEAASAGRLNTMHLAGGGPTNVGNNGDLSKGFGTRPSKIAKHNGGVHLLTK